MDIRSIFLQHFPTTVTILPTYRCNAACEQCCFESNPSIQGRLSFKEIESVIELAITAFPALRLIVFSGGECTLIKSDLYRAVSLVSQHKRLSRIVTNAGWGKSKRHATEVAYELSKSGLCECNISTGRDHQKWIPIDNVVNAAAALLDHGVTTLITVEADTPDGDCLNAIKIHPILSKLLKRESQPLMLMTNTWMPFNTSRINRKVNAPAQADCKQLFNNVVFTPHGEISACCGLTFEYIPEIKIGKITSAQSFEETFLAQLDDFLKIWIHVEGPTRIAYELLGQEGERLLKDTVHICQSCVIIHQNSLFRESLKRDYQRHIPRVMSKFYARTLLAAVESKSLSSQFETEIDYEAA
jgi:hypothetical protein